jgi:hypothetical protein
MTIKVSAGRRDVGGVDLASGNDDPAGKLVTSVDTSGEHGDIRSGQTPVRRTATVRLTTEQGGRGTVATSPTASSVHSPSGRGTRPPFGSVTIGPEVSR